MGSTHGHCYFTDGETRGTEELSNMHTSSHRSELWDWDWSPGNLVSEPVCVDIIHVASHCVCVHMRAGCLFVGVGVYTRPC